MANPRTRSNYEALLKFFREEMCSYKEASKRLGIPESAVKAAYESGWDDVPWGKSIRSVLEDEQVETRALRRDAEIRRIEEEEQLRSKAREDMMETRAQEARAAKATRANALGAAVAAARLVMSMRTMAEEVERRVNDRQTLQSMKMEDLRQWMKAIPQAVMQVGSTVKLALEIERIVAGEPLAMIGLRVDSMSPEQLQSQLQDLMDRLQRTGSLMTQRDEHEIEWEELEHGGAYTPPKVSN
jgi:hypothetical protein